MKELKERKVPAWIEPDRVRRAKALVDSGCQLTLDMKKPEPEPTMHQPTWDLVIDKRRPPLSASA